jgi:hypothetical protein
MIFSQPFLKKQKLVASHIFVCGAGGGVQSRLEGGGAKKQAKII